MLRVPTTRPLNALAVALLALLSAGCFGRSEIDGLGLRDRAEGQECRTDASCVEGLICEQELCVQPSGGPTTQPGRPSPDPTTCPGLVGQLDLDVPVVGTTAGKPNRYAATCGGGEAGEEVWLLVLDAPTSIVVTTEGSDFDTVVYIRRTCDDGPDVLCEDDLGADTAVLELAAGTWLVVVDGFGEAGDYELLVAAAE